MILNSTLQQTELNYFRLNLLSFLRDAHPDKANDFSFVAKRGDAAAESYSDAIKNGFDHVQASEIANQVLFEGLHFSPFNTIVTILWNEFSDEVPPGMAEQKAKGLYPECKRIFANYELNDDFADTTEYPSLYSELTGTISLLLDGIQ